MSYTAIMAVDGAGRVTKYADGFATVDDAQMHCDTFSDTFPNAYPVATLSAPVSDWLCDTVAKTAVNSPVVVTDAEAAAQVTLAARVFWETLRPALEAKGHAVGLKPVKVWLEEWVVASGSLTDPQKAAALDALQAQSFWRSDAYVSTLGALLGFSPAEIDTLFLNPLEN